MSLPNATDLSTLDFAYNGLPFLDVETNSNQNTNSLDFVFNGLPVFMAISGTTPVVFNATRMFMIF